MDVFQSSESVHPKKIFCLLLEHMPVWTDDVIDSQSLTEASLKEATVIKNIEKIKRGANYSIEFPFNMEKSVAPDRQVLQPPPLHTSGIESILHSPYVTRVERDAEERYDIVEKMLYFQMKELTIASDHPASTTEKNISVPYLISEHWICLYSKDI